MSVITTENVIGSKPYTQPSPPAAQQAGFASY